MRELILLRHAHADPAAPGQADIDRPLSLRGEAEADAAAAWLQAEGYLPDRVLCSPSERTRQTCARVQSVLGYADTRIEPRIYEASPGTLMSVADDHRSVGRVLMIGHNPGFEQMAALLGTGQSGDFRGMHTAGVAVLRLPPEQALEPGLGELVAFWSP